MPTYKVRLAILGRKHKDLRLELSRRGVNIDLANLSHICNGARTTWRIDRELEAKEEIEKILKEWEIA
jgi:hypothetical protein